MKYFFKSILTFSFWRYALLSGEALAKIFTVVGVLYAFIEMLDFFGIYTKDQYSGYSIVPMVVLAIVYVVITRRPITRVSYKVPGRDYVVEVRIGDIFSGTNDVIISTNTTFDTSMANGLIATDSLQGQVATRFFQANTDEIDRQLNIDLTKTTGTPRTDALGKRMEYPIGTVARVKAHGRTFYFVAMSRLNAQGTASASLREVEDALSFLWEFILTYGELKNLSVPLMGTGRGRTGFPRKKMSERIAQSFADGSKDRIFSNRLSIVIRPEDAENFGVNLYQIRDYLVQGLHG
ncbi:macro domain-containing protein [Inquilinus sp. CAU 1745]|uniref:macro domain-containing protein n=1 Tax=Inquilinus sp. CAU 1745 TaxID=3140369 RepID=UPI00325A4827